MEFHDVANLFPLLEGPDFDSLVQSIESEGQLEPIWLHEGKIIDGRNRYRACRKLDVEPKVRAWDGKGSLVAFVVGLNLKRRHLTSSQKAMVAAEIEPLLAKEAKERQRAAGGDRRSSEAKAQRETVGAKVPRPKRDEKASEKAAAITGTNHRYVSDAKKLKAEAPELAAKVQQGELTIPQAKAERRRQEKREELAEKAKRAEASPKKKDSTTWSLVNNDACAALRELIPGSARLIFADPPYNIGVDYGDGAKADSLEHHEFTSWVESWVQLCRTALTNDGSLWVMISDEYAAEFGVILKHHFTIRNWIKWYETFGVNCSDKFNRTSRHLFYCVKSPKKFVWNPDPVTRPSDRQTKYKDSRAQPGGKIWDDVWEIPRLVGTAAERIPDFPTQLPLALLRPIVGACSDPGDLVVDPFCGSATTGAVCIELGRLFLGVEKQAKFVELATQRLKGIDS